MNRGYIKIWRKIQDWEWYDEPLTLWFFIHLIFMANWENKRWHGTEVKRGQFISSIEGLRLSYRIGKRKCRMSTKEVRVQLDRLIGTNELAKEGTSKFTLFNIVNYNKYQDINSITEESERANEGQTKGKQRATTKEYKNIRIDTKEGGEVEKPTSPPPTPYLVFPTNGTIKEWTLTKERLDQLKSLYPAVDVEMECRRARDWAMREPKKRKTAGGMERFLNTWLSKEQNRHCNGVEKTKTEEVIL
jgi:hypothetical protein